MVQRTEYIGSSAFQIDFKVVQMRSTEGLSCFLA